MIFTRRWWRTFVPGWIALGVAVAVAAAGFVVSPHGVFAGDADPNTALVIMLWVLTALSAAWTVLVLVRSPESRVLGIVALGVVVAPLAYLGFWRVFLYL